MKESYKQHITVIHYNSIVPFKSALQVIQGHWKHEGRSLHKIQNDIILLIFKTWKFQNIRFVGNLLEVYNDIFMTMTSLLWRHLYLQYRQSVQYFASSFLLQLASVKQHCELPEKENNVDKRTFSNVNINVSFFNVSSKFI